MLNQKKLDTKILENAKTLTEEINNVKPILFGTTSLTIQDALTQQWVTKVPNDGNPHLVQVSAAYGMFIGVINRYSNNYGSGLLTRYNGATIAVFLNNGTVTTKNVTT